MAVTVSPIAALVPRAAPAPKLYRASSLGFVGYRIISRIKCSHLLVLFPPVFSSFFPSLFFSFPSLSSARSPDNVSPPTTRARAPRPYWKITRKATQRSFILLSCSVPSSTKIPKIGWERKSNPLCRLQASVIESFNRNFFLSSSSSELTVEMCITCGLFFSLFVGMKY